MHDTRVQDISDERQVIVNGEPRALPAASTLPALLKELGVDAEQTRGVAVAVNEEVVPRRKWHGISLASGDRVEVVTAKQGG